MALQTFITYIKNLFHSPHSPELTLEQLQQLFQKRYSSFRKLLTANNNALEAMAEMEQSGYGNRAYSMAFIRFHATAISVNVYKMVQALEEMSDGRYTALNGVFDSIQKQIDTIIDPEVVIPDGAWTLPLSTVTGSDVELVGEKMANLGEVKSLPDIKVPEGFVISTAATRYFLTRNDLYKQINRILQQVNPDNMENLHERCHEIQSLIMRAQLPQDLEKHLYSQYDHLVDGYEQAPSLAIRSSALGEDSPKASFAGLYSTEINVSKDDFIQSYKTVVASTYSSRAVTYRLTRGLRHEATVMSVGCLVMIKAAVSGVCYSQSLSGSPGTLDIFCSAGYATGIVDGTKDTQHYILSCIPPHKMISKEVPPQKPLLLSRQQMEKIANVAVQLEQHFGAPQDIEWSVDATGELFTLQSRPISVNQEKSTTAPQVISDNNQIILQGGTTGSRGVASGRVFIVKSTIDLLRFPENSVLVVEHPLPKWAPLMRKAVALIAETGSAAGHLVTIAREYGIPAIVALKGAVKMLANGMEITIAADQRCIYRGKVDQLLLAEKKQKSLMDGSPVAATMKKVLKLITPLHLTDPASPFFRASYCQTLHDITRFCHEKSVVEMFDFGKRYHFAKGAAKRLVADMPLEWWVINLADGFSEEFDPAEKYINITQITAPPMLAIWEGMHYSPWEGPPTANARGMGAIIFQSTRQPGIDPAVRSAMIEKNYFLISSNYCNLSVRLGYHYAMIEAFISDLRTERYVTFRFKGGAADAQRRTRRIKLLADILQKNEFRVDINSDALIARVEKRSKPFLFNCLRILGYLTIHTRQIDMVMNSSVQYKHYQDKFFHDIEEMIHNGHNRDRRIESGTAN